MDISVPTNKKLRTEVEERDWISGLPDSLLLHILAYVSAKEAVATSLLSKRWRPLWRSLPTLYLKREDFQRLKSFHRFVDKMLKFVDLKSVKTFVLWFTYYQTREYFRPGKINKWIDAVISINEVEHLELHLQPHKGNYEFPSSVFTANNLKVLKLSGRRWMSWISQVTVGTLSRANLPFLEVLHLQNVNFPDGRSLGMILSSCPLLKDLVLKDLCVANFYPLDVGTLNHLVTAEVITRRCLLPLQVFSNATFLNLHTYEYGSKVVLSPKIPAFYNLTTLELGYYSHGWNRTLKYLQSCPKLEILVIHQFDCSEGLGETTIDVPPCVSSKLKEFHLKNYRGKSGEFELARFIMKNAMVLRIISISKDSLSRATWESRNLKRISKCSISSVNCRLLLK